MARIFVSYKRLNKDQVFPLVEKIEQQVGEKCWVDLEGIESSVQFASVICRAIDNADVVLFMHSSMHLSIDFEKDWTVKELTYAQAKGKRVQLLKLDSSPLDNIFLMEYGSKNNIDTNDPLQFNKLINDLRSWLGKPAVIPAAHAASNLVNLKVLSNMDCKVLIDCEDKGVAVADRLMKIPLAPGEYYVEFVSAKNPDTVISKEITLTQDKIEKVDLPAIPYADADLIPYISNGKVGFADKHTRKIVIPCRYEYANSFSEGLANVVLKVKEGIAREGYIDKSGNEVIPCVYERAFSFSEGLAKVKINGKFGHIDKSGKVAIPCMYDDVSPFAEGLACVKLDGKEGFIDRYGKGVIPCIYERVFPFSEGLACVKQDGKYGYIDKSGRVVIPFEYGDAFSFSEGLACVSRDYDGIKGMYGYIDKAGKLAIPYKYALAKPFSEGMACVRSERYGNCGFIDKYDKVVLPFIYKSAGFFNEGLTYVRPRADSRLYGYMDKAGKIVVPCKYDVAGPFSGGLAYVQMNGEHGNVDIFGNDTF